MYGQEKASIETKRTEFDFDASAAWNRDMDDLLTIHPMQHVRLRIYVGDSRTAKCHSVEATCQATVDATCQKCQASCEALCESTMDHRMCDTRAMHYQELTLPPPATFLESRFNHHDQRHGCRYPPLQPLPPPSRFPHVGYIVLKRAERRRQGQLIHGATDNGNVDTKEGIYIYIYNAMIVVVLALEPLSLIDVFT
jgi:hypothetical protein